MVYVATGGDNPEKMPFLFLMPHLRQSDFIDLCHWTKGFSMLGFGDLQSTLTFSMNTNDTTIGGVLFYPMALGEFFFISHNREK